MPLRSTTGREVTSLNQGHSADQQLFPHRPAVSPELRQSMRSNPCVDVAIRRELVVGTTVLAWICWAAVSMLRLVSTGNCSREPYVPPSHAQLPAHSVLTVILGAVRASNTIASY